MKTIHKILGTWALACFALAFGACTEEAKYTPADVPGGEQVYFANNLGQRIELKKDATSFDVEVRRINTESTATVNITASGANSNFTIPGSVTFAAGQEVAPLSISYKADEMEYEDFCTITLTLNDESVKTPYGEASYTFQAGIPAPWTSLGKATFVEDFMSALYSGVENIAYEVEIQENDLTSGYYRLVNPFGAAYPFNAPGQYDTSKDYYLEIHAENPEAVYISIQGVGMDWGYGEVLVGSLAGYYLANGGLTPEEIAEKGYFGTFEEGVISFPASTMLAGEAGYNSGALYIANANGAFRVAMPGVELTDYTVEINYAGKYTDVKNNDAGVMAQISKVGEDVEYIRLALIEGEDVVTAVNGILDETLETMEIPAEVTTVQIPFPAAPVEGSYTLIAVSYGNKEAQSVSYSTFKYTLPAAAETWTDAYAGTFTYSLWWSADG